jgi:hypothetical protein
VARELGRAALISTICAPANFLAQYNRAAQHSNSTRHTALPLWPSAFMDSLGVIARVAPR